MNRFWNKIMLPIIEGINAKYLVEIGADTGIGTQNLLKYCVETNGHLTAIDPFPQFNVEELEKQYGKRFEIIQELSLNALPDLKDYDVILIDGDHNWYTVYNELKIIESNFNEENFPLIFLHDIGWPYGRRDLYYNPENIPEPFRQEYSTNGIYPSESELREHGGLNYGLCNAVTENTPKNGVLTAVEDFINESDINLHLEKIDAFFGLGILFPKNKDLENLVKKVIDKSDLLKIVEKDHLLNFINLENRLSNSLFEKQTEVNILNQELNGKKRELMTKTHELNTNKSELNRIRTKFFKSQNNLNKTKRNLKKEKTKYKKAKRELKAIKSSDFWKLALKYYHLRDHVWPFNTIFNSIKKRKAKKTKTKAVKKKSSTPTITRNNAKYDIIFFSIINYNYKYHQRPQHIADFFADKGHQVHYFNTHFSKKHTTVKEVNKNFRIVSLHSKEKFITQTNFLENLDDVCKELDKYISDYNITDCVVFIEFPNWAYLGKYLKDKYGFKVVFDVLDEFSGFHPDDIRLIKSSHYLMKNADLITTSSKFLYEKCAQNNDNVEIVRNGVEFLHFNNYYSKEKPKNQRPVIGYYGALAHWFDFDKVEYLAKERPEYEIILIGNTKDSDEKVIEKLERIPNIKFTGAKNYNELPQYLKKFDVALIPFRDDQDLIKATNPVKFYEYLSMGKKIVSTEIPELKPYKDRFVYLAKDKDQFVKYIDICVKNEDELASEEERIEFAKTQDWENRGEAIGESIKKLYGLVSIVVVTYNNFNYTQMCIESILEKTAYPKYELIITDNKSTDNTRRYLLRLQEKYDNIKVILNEDNLGFAKANNMGIEQSSGDYIVLLNNDTIVTAGWLSGLVKHLDNNKNLGLLGPVTNNISNEAKIEVSYKKLEDLEKFASKNRTKNLNKLYFDIKVLAMFCLAIKRDVFEDIGPLDEEFSVGMFEDDDYSYRALRKGYEIAFAEDVFIHHVGCASFKKLKNEEYMRIFNKNKAIFEKKWNIQWESHNNQRDL